MGTQGGDLQFSKLFEVGANALPNAENPMVPPPYLSSRGVMKKRYIGGRNVMVAGIMLSQKRLNMTDCSEVKGGAFEILESLQSHILGISRENRRNIANLVSECMSKPTSEIGHEPFGVDPVFLSTATMYDSSGSIRLSDFYPNTTLIPWTEPGSGAPPAPVRLIGEDSGVPYGFIPIQYYVPPEYVDREKDFSIFFDVNLDNAQATNILNYIQQGFFFDRQTDAVILDGLYYNPDLLTFTYVKITITIDPSGFYRLERKVTPFSVDNYRTSTDLFRTLLEVVVSMMLLVNVFYEFRQMYRDGRRYWHHASNLFDWCHFGVQAAAFIIWIDLQKHYQRFQPRPRYYVYRNLEAPANYLALNKSADTNLLTENDGVRPDMNEATENTNLAAVNHMLMSASTISDKLSGYHFAQMLSIVMFLVRLLSALHFQPRLGLVTRTIKAAGTDIMHWMLLFMMVWLAFVVAGHLSFGNTVYEFSTIELAMLSVMKMTLGELDMLEQFILFVPTDKMLAAQLVSTYYFCSPL